VTDKLLSPKKGGEMNLNYQRTWMSVLAGFLRLLVVSGLGLLLGAMGEVFSWNRQDNFWLYLCLLCPLLLGISVALMLGERARSRWLVVLGAGTLAWIGFYLTCVVIAFRVHPLPASTSTDPSCSPCFDGPLFAELFFGEFFPVGLAFVVITALATSWLLQMTRRNRYSPEVSHSPFRERSFNERAPLPFPLFRQTPSWLHMLVLLLSSLLLALGRTYSGPVLLSLYRMQTPLPFLSFYPSFYLPFFLSFFPSLFLPLLFQGLLLATSTLLCGMFFGSWRGTLVCGLAIAGSLLLPSFLHNGAGYSFSLKSLLTLTFLLTSLSTLCATLVVGLIYERRKYKNSLASFFTLLLGGTIVFAFSFVNSSGLAFDLFGLVIMCQMSGMAVLIALCVEVLLQNLLDFRKRRLELTT
jgi:hypothetical protein